MQLKREESKKDLAATPFVAQKLHKPCRDISSLKHPFSNGKHTPTMVGDPTDQLQKKREIYEEGEGTSIDDHARGRCSHALVESQKAQLAPEADETRPVRLDHQSG
jgi:hypothetical protein